MPVTTLAELNSTLCSVIFQSTGRKAWNKVGIQAAPKFPYAVVFLSSGDGFAQDIVVDEMLDPATDEGSFYQNVLGTLRLECVVEFFKNGDDSNDTAQAAALRFKRALQLQERMFDLWLLCGLTGPIQYIDISAMFRADTEPRAQIRFHLYTNLGEEPIAGNYIPEIEHQTIQTGFHRLDGELFPITTTVENDEGG